MVKLIAGGAEQIHIANGKFESAIAACHATAIVSETFLMLNGFTLTASDAEVVVALVALAAGELSEEELADWFRQHVESA